MLPSLPGEGLILFHEHSLVSPCFCPRAVHVGDVLEGGLVFKF